jgi:hypothetical protein
MESIEVTAVFDGRGGVTPLSISRVGRKTPVDCGRSWQDEQGLHVLVMAPGEQVLELLFVAAELRWYVRSPGGGGKPA